VNGQMIDPFSGGNFRVGNMREEEKRGRGCWHFRCAGEETTEFKAR
jgi:hypothetical protein